MGCLCTLSTPTGAVTTFLLATFLAGAARPGARAAGDVYPEHITPETLLAVRKGLDYLAATQGQDGGWRSGKEGNAYPVSLTALAGMALLANGNTPSRGRYADPVRRALHYLMARSQPSGLITGASQEDGRPMYGHGFALMFLSVVYGMETNERNRERLAEMIRRAVKLTAAAQSPYGGWTYIPGGGDEGSVTVTQIQALRAAHNAGFSVPRGTIEEAVRYIERCRTSEGGIRYSLRSGNDTRLPISAAAVATLYNAGEYESPVAESCLDYVFTRFQSASHGWNKGGGHLFYMHLYAAQAFYMASDRHWNAYFPAARDHLLATQDKEDGSWQGDGVGKVYGTSIALTILQLPYKFMPIYQR